MISITEKNGGSLFWGLLALIITMSALNPGVLRAEEKSVLSVAKANSEAGVVPVSMTDELFGFALLAEAADKYRPASADPLRPGDVSFIVAGEVRSPGEYTLPAPINLLSALLAAGGPVQTGNLRQVQVFLDGSLLGEFDLYGYLHDGRIVDDFIFNGGEQVVVLPHGSRVSISGHVKIPAVYELKSDEMNLSRLLEFCGGLVRSQKAHRIEVIRVENSQRNIVFSADVKPDRKVPAFALQAGDRVNVCEVSGSRPGSVFAQFPDGSRREFGLRQISRLSQLIAELQPLSEHIATSYVELLREGRPDKKFEVIGISLEAFVRMVAEGDKSHDLVLMPGDRLMLFDRDFIEKKPVVGMQVKGKPPIFTDFRPGMKVSDLLQITDFELSPRLVRARIVRRKLNGARLESMSLLVDVSAIRRGNRRHDIELQPFDVLEIQL